MEAIALYITTASEEEAKALARGVIEEKLAACAQVLGPITSVYRWDGKICEDREYRMVVKSRRDLFSRLSQYIRANHSYETPQIIALPIIEGSEKYLKWLDDSCRGADG